jgi:ABC transporter substrate binding protein
VADGGERADREAADYRFPGHKYAGVTGALGCRSRSEAARARLDRGSHHRDRVPLGGRRDERYSKIAAEFVRLRVDAILTQGTQAAMAAKQATSVIPIVATVIGDPVGSGLVASLALPGGNVTGLSVVSYDLAAKRLELLLEAVPGVRRVGILVDVGNPVNVEEARQVQAAADKLGLEGFPIAIRRAEDIVPAFDGLKNAPMPSLSSPIR